MRGIDPVPGLEWSDSALCLLDVPELLRRRVDRHEQNWPSDFQAACDLEADARLKDPHFYLHPACVPLSDVDFGAQTTMFADRGCTEGCFT